MTVLVTTDPGRVTVEPPPWVTVVVTTDPGRVTVVPLEQGPTGIVVEQDGTVKVIVVEPPGGQVLPPLTGPTEVQSPPPTVEMTVLVVVTVVAGPVHWPPTGVLPPPTGVVPPPDPQVPDAPYPQPVLVESRGTKGLAAARMLDRRVRKMCDDQDDKKSYLKAELAINADCTKLIYMMIENLGGHRESPVQYVIKRMEDG